MLKLIAILFFQPSVVYSQKLIATNVNSPQALNLNSEKENTIIKLNSQKAILAKNSMKPKANESDQKALMKIIDSLETRFLQLRQMYANEILNSNDSKLVLKKMKEAHTSGPKGLSENILMEYRRQLLEDAAQKWRKKEIDKSTYQKEVKAIDKVINSFEIIVYLPTERKELFR
ncbi:hypothetical protein [Sphingobacterium siyangense]|uniref:hypothetical protein n=1 Tax=Sphingobacterium siyangense TaxID=459529 RepID=UPI003C7719BB